MEIMTTQQNIHKNDSFLKMIENPVLLQGDNCSAYRDPAVVYNDGIFYLYFTLVETDSADNIFLYTAMSKSNNLQKFSEPVILTPQDKSLNFSSPGNIIRYRDCWIMCLQTYSRQNGEKYGNSSSRIWIMSSKDLENWSIPKLLYVKGDDIKVEDMGRMIDPYIIKDKCNPNKYWCFYKQNGISMSYSYNLKHWHYCGSVNAGENVCIIEKDDHYYMFHSPRNGIGIMVSDDLLNWTDTGKLITLGQLDWTWAQGRITAGFVLDCRHIAGVGKYLMFFHGTGPENEEVIFDKHACIGIAWSDNLFDWEYPEL